MDFKDILAIFMVAIIVLISVTLFSNSPIALVVNYIKSLIKKPKI